LDYLSASTTEKKDLARPALQVAVHGMGSDGQPQPHHRQFRPRGSVLDPVDEEDRSNENRALKNFNEWVEPTRLLIVEVDTTNVADKNVRRPSPGTSRCDLSLSLSLSPALLR
jgi:hypothetical protein